MPMLHANFTALCFIEPSYCRSKFYIAGIGIFDVFFALATLTDLTFIYELDPYSLEIYRMYEYELPMSRLSKVVI